MKKFICLLTLTFALVLMNTSCTKSTDDNNTPTIKTLNERYPDWVDLTWVSTNGQSLTNTYPKLEIKIVNDTVAHVIETPFDGASPHDYTFLGLSVVAGNTATFGDPITIGTSIEMVGNLIFTISSFTNGKITLSSNRFVDKTATQYIFVLQKN